MALAEAAFSKMKWMKLECPDPDESEFTKLAAFLKDSNSEQLLQNLVKICDKRFSKEKEPESRVLGGLSRQPGGGCLGIGVCLGAAYQSDSGVT